MQKDTINHETPAIVNVLLGDVPFIEEVIPKQYDSFKSEYFFADFNGRLEEFKKGLPKGYAIVKSGIVKDGDLVWSFINEWKVNPVYPTDKESYRHYKDSPVGFWHCVARHIA